MRDPGGLPIASGGRTRWRSVVRSDSLQSLTGAGWDALVTHGVRTIVDLRAQEERERQGYALPDAALAAGVRYLGVTMRPMDPALHARLVAMDLPEGYVLMVDTLRPGIAGVLRAIAQAAGGGVVIHCSAGRDRTVIISPLLLALASVPVEVNAADYLASQSGLWPRWEVGMAALADPATANDPATLEAIRREQPLLEAETMLCLLRNIDDRWAAQRGTWCASDSALTNSGAWWTCPRPGCAAWAATGAGCANVSGSLARRWVAPPCCCWTSPPRRWTPLSRRDVLALIERLAGETTVFLSTHILADVERIYDQVAMLARGRLLAQADQATLRERYAAPVFEIELATDGPAIAALSEQLRVGIPPFLWTRINAEPGTH